ncbi:Dehydrogenase/reductase SDR family member 1 [Sciurus carolinensis]|uniref:Dehydrogenase/reductase SDR family member 1 n=1 Tax=Sciurus carolinensis TaxID=30640 RepID=A0AA41MRL0_SCICA|nr:Dehydrogenase/reductase SDR family member 1 [Sciurus carolinensis]
MDTLRATAQEAQSFGGWCAPVVCDSSQESEVQSLFEQVDQEQHGRLDVLVSNADAGVQTILNTNQAFWEAPASLWDGMNNVGLRGHYLPSVYGARLLVPAGEDSSWLSPSLEVCSTCSMSPMVWAKLRVTDWLLTVPRSCSAMGSVMYLCGQGWYRQLLKDYVAKEGQPEDSLFKHFSPVFSSAESTEMSGKCVVALATDPNILSLSGKGLLSCDLARCYGLQDVDGCAIQDYFSLSSVLSHVSRLG